MRSTGEHERDSVLQDLESADEEVRRLAVERIDALADRTFCRDSRSGWGIPTGACARPPCSASPRAPTPMLRQRR